MLGLTARYADSWNAYFTHTQNRAAGVAPLREKVDAACRAAGRDPATLTRTAAVLVTYGEVGAATLAPHWEFPPLTGAPDTIAAELRAYADEGISHLILWLEPNTLASIEAFAPVLEVLDRG
jgi:alkanesulfonate monooxygenase SsuD/methylene tetrahydromethanopterin reductase-like flavin-dependent oxidoreductase (luciferase family)